MIYFTYAFVNMGMVSGILPVGRAAAFMSYGGTALLTLGLGAGILMSIQRHRKLGRLRRGGSPRHDRNVKTPSAKSRSSAARHGAGGTGVRVFLPAAARFIWLQVIKHANLPPRRKRTAFAGAHRAEPRPDFDRNGVVLARNYSAYTLEITPSKLAAPLDEVIDQLSKLVAVELKDRKRFKKLLEESKNFESVPLRTRLTDEEGALYPQRFRFPAWKCRRACSASIRWAKRRRT
jgi:hypothetical protein